MQIDTIRNGYRKPISKTHRNFKKKLWGRCRELYDLGAKTRTIEKDSEGAM